MVLNKCSSSSDMYLFVSLNSLQLEALRISVTWKAVIIQLYLCCLRYIRQEFARWGFTLLSSLWCLILRVDWFAYPCVLNKFIVIVFNILLSILYKLFFLGLSN